MAATIFGVIPASWNVIRVTLRTMLVKNSTMMALDLFPNLNCLRRGQYWSNSFLILAEGVIALESQCQVDSRVLEETSWDPDNIGMKESQLGQPWRGLKDCRQIIVGHPHAYKIECIDGGRPPCWQNTVRRKKGRNRHMVAWILNLARSVVRRRESDKSKTGVVPGDDLENVFMMYEGYCRIHMQNPQLVDIWMIKSTDL
ncbi:MAG: hypothetical protein J3R72DRAFT_423243 [Linnemannia gamsii]|nr:MAG: hypothetical protein J3R72DRAFT_423243 [Linnemannia gamsii]